MRFLFACLFLMVCTCACCVGCGRASSIEEGVPANVTAPPPDFDPGGGVAPDMSGKGVAPAKK